MTRDGQVLPHYIECHFFRSYRCGRCGKRPEQINTLYPQIRRNGAEIELIYPIRCPCGGYGSQKVEMPLLLFGELLTSVEIVHGHNRWAKPRTLKPLWPKESEFFKNVLGRFRRVMQLELARSRCDPTTEDRVCFDMSDEGWADFMRRLGLSATQGDADENDKDA